MLDWRGPLYSNAHDRRELTSTRQVGNKGFDPFNCATSESVLKNYREAELKHGRLAMLAAAGWPVSELVQPWLSAALSAPDLLASGDKAPSILNGGLDKVRPALPAPTAAARLPLSSPVTGPATALFFSAPAAAAAANALAECAPCVRGGAAG